MDIHVLKQSQDKKTFTVAFHIDIPVAATNEAGITYREALVVAGVEPSVVGNITTAENDQLLAGEIIEVVTDVRWSSLELTKAEKLAELAAAYTAKKDSLRAIKTTELEFTGYETDIV